MSRILSMEEDSNHDETNDIVVWFSIEKFIVQDIKSVAFRIRCYIIPKSWVLMKLLRELLRISQTVYKSSKGAS